MQGISPAKHRTVTVSIPLLLGKWAESKFFFLDNWKRLWSQSDHRRKGHEVLSKFLKLSNGQEPSPPRCCRVSHCHRSHGKYTTITHRAECPVQLGSSSPPGAGWTSMGALFAEATLAGQRGEERSRLCPLREDCGSQNSPVVRRSAVHPYEFNSVQLPINFLQWLYTTRRGGKKEATRHEIQSKRSHALRSNGVHLICKGTCQPTTVAFVKFKWMGLEWGGRLHQTPCPPPPPPYGSL